jgi:tryptophan synthase alpha chain
VTGHSNIGDIELYVKRVKRSAKNNSVLVGFGIKTPADAQRIAQYADGVIVGSALIKRIAKKNSVKEIGGWVRQLKKAL